MSSLEAALRACRDVQHMIDINSEHLERLRAPVVNTSTHSSFTSEQLTKQEIRTLEGKLVKHFSKQLATRASLVASERSLPEIAKYPSLQQWLKVVGINKESVDVLESRVSSLDCLKEKTDSELNRLLLQARLTERQRHEDLRRLSRALQNLRKYTDILLHGQQDSAATKLNDLCWDSWESVSVSTGANKREESPKSEAETSCWPVPGTPTSKPVKWDSAASSLSSTSSAPPPSPGLALSPPILLSGSDRRVTPPTTPPWTSVFAAAAAANKKEAHSIITNSSSSSKFPTTPPPNRKHSTGIQRTDYPLTKSKSHESELGNRVTLPNANAVAVAAAAVAQQGGGQQEANGQQPRLVIGSSGSMMTQSHSQTTSSCSMATTSTGATSTRTSCSDMPVLTPSESSTSVNSNNVDHPQHHPKVGIMRQRKLPSDPVNDHMFDIATGPSPVASPKSPPNPFDPIDGNGPYAQSTLQVPKSPRTPRGMGHVIRHIFSKTFKPARCDLCTEYMFNGLKCKECKFKCHKDCAPLVPPSCKLPEDLIKYYITHLTKEGSPILPRLPQPPHSSIAGSNDRLGGGNNPSLHIPAYPDSSSNTSSCNSSTPNSPVVLVTSHPTPPHSASIYHKARQFTFPDTSVSVKMQQEAVAAAAMAAAAAQQQQQQYQQQPQKVSSPNPVIDSVKSYDSDKTLSGSSGSASTACRLNSQDSTASVDESNSNSWIATRQTSISMREWDIPYEELNIGDKIGSGRFSTVHQGNWHGDVAIKILDMENMDDEATLEAFRLDVATFRKTRHENLILFMGACMNPPKLAIVTSLCKGNTLYTHLHLRRDKFSMNKIVIIAQQIAQGMGYLHHRGIVHKDLKTKNIFLENGRAIITDFGLVNVARRLCARHEGPGNIPCISVLTEREFMSIPKGWLCYLAPEIMRTLRVQPDEGEDLPFTKASDVYAFGTVWYELLTGEWPWKHQPPETIIWLVGRGMKPSLANLQASRDVKDILVMCWTFKSDHRPDFTHLSNTLEKIPKKRLARSPSHPVHLSRSAESVF